MDLSISFLKSFIPGKLTQDLYDLNKFSEFLKLAYPQGLFLEESKNSLTYQELKCLMLISQGKTMKLGAREMGISIKTFESYIANIKKKTQLDTRHDLVKLFQDKIGKFMDMINKR